MSSKKKILLAWVTIYVALGVFSGFTGLGEREPRAFNFIASIATMVLIYIWCRAEASERRELVPSGYTMFAALLPPIGVPVYFARTRKRFGPAARSTLKAFGFYTGAMLLLLVAESLTNGLQT